MHASPDILLLRLFRATKRRLQAIAERHGLTFPQLIALLRLYRNGAMAMSELSAHLAVTRGALTGLIDRLEENGLVSRCPDAQDRRVITLTLTPRGKETMAAVVRDWQNDVQDWLDPLDESTRQGFLLGLQALTSAEAAHAQ